MSVGNTSTGTLQIGAGGIVSNGSGFVGRQTTGIGAVTVSGAGAQWINGPGLSVGQAGKGTLGITNGGFVSSATNSYIGVAAGSTGTITVDGLGSRLSSVEALNVGLTGNGTLNIASGGIVSNGFGYVGYETAGIGSVTVSGLGSQWNNSNELTVGRSGSGKLDIASGGAVSNTNGLVGSAANSTGKVTVDGSSSSWANSGALTVGNFGNGTLTIANNGTVSAASARAGVNSGSSGVINIGAAASALAAAPGTLTLTGPSPALTLGATGLLVFNHTDTSGGYVFAPGITGAGKVAVYSGTTVLTAGNTYTGGTTIAGGTLQLGNAGITGSIVGNVANNGVLVLNRSDSVTFAGAISGSGTVNQIGSGTTILTGGSTYTGGTTISLGALQLGNGGVTGSIVGDVANSGTLAFNRSDTMTFAGAISGAGAVNQIGAGTSVLTGANTYTGGTTITAGVLQLGNGGSTGSIVGNVTNNGTLTFNRSDVMPFAGVISGSGTVNQNGTGTGTTILTAANIYTGETTISAGTLQLGNGGVTGSLVGNVTNNGALAFNRSDVLPFAGAISGSGTVNQNGTGTTILTADNTYTGGTAISAGTLQLGNGGVSGSLLGNVTNNGALAFNRSDVVPFIGLISGSGTVNQNGTGTTILTAANTYTGGTTISAGTLQLGDGGVTGSILGNVTNNGALAFNRSDVLPFAGVISGSGTVNQNGTGTTILTAGNTYSGTTAINAGVLQAGAASTFSPNSATTVTGAGTLDLNGFNQTIAGATNAGLINMGTGTLPGTTLTTPNYVGQGGRISVNTYLADDNSPSDRLVIDGGVASGTSSIHVANAGGPGALTTGNGILVVNAVNGGTTATNAFTLGNPGGYVAAGPYAYTLFRSSADTSAPQSWYLRSTIDCATAGKNPACDGPAPPPDPTPTPTPAPPNYRPEVSTAVVTPELALRYGETLLDSLHERMGEERFFNRPVSPNGKSLAWGRIIGVTGDRNGSRSGILGSRGPDYDYKIYAVQSGIDLYQQENADGSIDHAGMYAAFGRATADVDHIGGRFAGQAAMNGVSLGSYWTHIGKEGWYVDGVVQGTRYDVDNARSPAGLNLDTRGFGFGASLETGYPFRLNDEWLLEPQAQLVYQTINLNDANDGAAKIRFSDVDSLRGRLGVRIARTVELEPDHGEKRIATAWFRTSLVNEFLTNPTTQFSSQAGYVPFRSDMRGLALQLNVGADVRVKRNVSVYGSFGSEISLQGDGQNLNGKLGVKIAF